MIRKTFFGFTLIFIGLNCSGLYFPENGERAFYTELNQALFHNSNKKDFLKAHLQNGDVYIFDDQWQVDTAKLNIIGNGTLYNLKRESVKSGLLTVPVSDIVLYETNKIPTRGRDAILVPRLMIGAGSIAMTVYCQKNPKACFGSCPTFYLEESPSVFSSNAEAFSNAVLPSFEKRDIDALQNGCLEDCQVKLTMKNEALETHCIREAVLLGIPRDAGENVFHSPKKGFYKTGEMIAPDCVWHEAGSMITEFQDADEIEWFSLVDEQDLNTKEEIFLEFDSKGKKDLGLAIRFRQTLMTTYLFYSSLDYMGAEYGEILSKIERDKDLKKRTDLLNEILGGIEIFSWSERKKDWIFEGQMLEIGPIAHNLQLMPLLKNPTTSKIKLRLNKGLWRIDMAALVPNLEKVEPIRMKADFVRFHGENRPDLCDSLTDSEAQLISMPGEVYELYYQLPEERDYALFLDAKGYYLEWMRDEWLKASNPKKLFQLLVSPAKYLKGETAAYKEYEKTMEAAFWNSKIECELLTDNEL